MGKSSNTLFDSSPVWLSQRSCGTRPVPSRGPKLYLFHQELRTYISSIKRCGTIVDAYRVELHQPCQEQWNYIRPTKNSGTTSALSRTEQLNQACQNMCRNIRSLKNSRTTAGLSRRVEVHQARHEQWKYIRPVTNSGSTPGL